MNNPEDFDMEVAVRSNRRREVLSMAPIQNVEIGGIIEAMYNSAEKINKFEEMVIEIKNIKLVEHLRYVVSLQFLERVQKCGDIKAIEKMQLKDVI